MIMIKHCTSPCFLLKYLSRKLAEAMTTVSLKQLNLYKINMSRMFAVAFRFQHFDGSFTSCFRTFARQKQATLLCADSFVHSTFRTIRDSSVLCKLAQFCPAKPPAVFKQFHANALHIPQWKIQHYNRKATPHKEVISLVIVIIKFSSSDL